jgi:transcriptional regulator with XRE-family HTH domain
MPQQQNTNGDLSLGQPRGASPIDCHVGHQLRLRRVALGLSQEQLGAATGVTFQQIQKYEKGHNRISASRLYGFAQALKCSVAFFFNELPSQTLDGAVADDKLDRISQFIHSIDGLKLIEAFTRIPQENVQRAIIRLVGVLAGNEDSTS